TRAWSLSTPATQILTDIFLKGLNFKDASPHGRNCFRDRKRPRNRCVVRNLVHQGGSPDGRAIGQSFCTFGCVENDVHFAVLHRVDDVGPSLQHLVDSRAGNSIRLKVTQSAASREHLEAHIRKFLDRLDYARLVGFPDRYEQGSRSWQTAAAPELAFGKGDGVAAVDAHDLARGPHLGTEHGIDLGEALKGKNRLLDSDMPDFRPRQVEGGKLLARHHTRRDGRHGMANDFGDERHRAARTRVYLEHVDFIALYGELNVHEPDNLQRTGDVRGLPFQLLQRLRVERVRRKGARAVAGMNARLLDVLHDAGDKNVFPIRDRVNVDLGRVAHIGVEEKRVFAQDKIDLRVPVAGKSMLDIRRDERCQRRF